MGAAVDTVIIATNELPPTTPPPGQGPTEIPSARPTSVPDFDPQALATACLHDAKLAMPMDLFVPARTAAVSEGLDLRSAFLLLHVDGRSSLAEIAHWAQLPIDDVVASFFRLVALGAVEMTAKSDIGRAPESGVFPRMLRRPTVR